MAVGLSQPDPDNAGGGSMKTRLFTIFLFTCIVCSLSAFGSKDKIDRANEVVVYTYDSFAGEWGPGPQLAAAFEAKTGLKCRMLVVGDGAQILSRAVLESSAPQADVVLGVDNNQISLARSSQVLEAYQPQDALSIVPEELQLTDDWLLTPYDWSYFSIIYNKNSSVPAPQSLEDLTKEVYKKKIILMDPRTSTPGLGFVAWTVAVFGEKYLDYWQALKPNILTMAPSWSTGYGFFTSGEAPLVVSYTTSPAYHIEYDEGDQFTALIFPEGHSLQIEGAALVKNAPNAEGGRLFLDFLISQQAQEMLPLTQWMYPVNPAVELPASYNAAPQAEKALTVDNETLSEAVEAVMALLAQ
jgi:thiamine transport system substrate-binding protein